MSERRSLEQFLEEVVWQWVDNHAATLMTALAIVFLSCFVWLLVWAFVSF